MSTEWNKGWIKRRLQFWRCRHSWFIGDRKGGSHACRKCGVWRWWPRIESTRPTSESEAL